MARSNLNGNWLPYHSLGIHDWGCILVQKLRLSFCIIIMSQWLNALVTVSWANNADQNQTITILAGSYTNHNNAGLHVFTIDPKKRQLYGLNKVKNTKNTSFAVNFPKNHGKFKTHFYGVDESSPGKLLTFRWHAEKSSVSIINQVSSFGDYPCYLALGTKSNQLAVANYNGGTVAVYGLDTESGAITGKPVLLQHKGRSQHKQRQTESHTHWVQWSPDGRFLFTVDLGTDRITGYHAQKHHIQKESAFNALQLSAGDGPRHMVFHPEKPLAYIINELSNTVVVVQIDQSGHMQILQRLDTLPEHTEDKGQAGHIAITKDGRFLYASNRGHDSIAVFRTNRSGLLSLIETVPSGGQWPRFFTLVDSDKILLVANQHSNNIKAFTRKQDGGLIPWSSALSITQPALLLEP